ncbi:hypothetical protein D3C81_851570 [compost metagenome]
MQVFQAVFLELAEDLKVITTAGQDRARTEEQLVEITVRLNCGSLQKHTHSLVPTLFVDAVFVIPVHAFDPILMA